MKIIDPHIHCYSRTTNDYQVMHEHGVRAVVEPSFWLGQHRRHAGTFFDYFQHILEFEVMRARRFGIDHYACIAMNPKEADDLKLANEVMDGMDEHLRHERCVAVGEIGFNLITPNEEKAFQRQLEMAKKRNMLIMIHSPHDTPTVSKRAGVERTMAMIRELNYDPGRILVDHNTENTMDISRKAPVWTAMTVYPYSKLSPERVIGIIKKWGLERMMINSAADWGVSDPTNVSKVVRAMKEAGFAEARIEQLVFKNPLAFYGQSGRFKPQLDLSPVDPSEYQR